MLYTAVKSYKASKDDEVTVAIGAVVEALQKSDNGWWLIRYLTLLMADDDDDVLMLTFFGSDVLSRCSLNTCGRILM